MYEPLLRAVRPLELQSNPGNGHDGASEETFVVGISDSSLLPRLPQHSEAIRTRLKSLMGRDVAVEFRPFSPQDASNNAELPRWLNRNHTFDRFLKSNSNQMAVMACEAVVAQPGRSNPLYLHGDSGMGKTHLVHALSAELLRRHPGIRICYTSFEDLRDEFLKSVSSKQTLEFKEGYRGYDVLVIEDIQYLRPTSESLQEEFFHIFNHYYESGKQIVLTSERPAAELMVGSRLMSRLLSGLQVRIGTSEPGLREAVVDDRSREMNLDLSADVRQYLCSRVTTSIRELESALNKIYFLQQKGVPADSVKSVQEHLQDFIPTNQNLFFSLDQIVEVVCRRYNITREQILSSSRKAEYTLPRHIAMYLGIQYSNLNKSAIARYFRKSDHTTVINAERNIQKRIQKEMGFAQLLEEIVSELRKDGA